MKTPTTSIDPKRFRDQATGSCGNTLDKARHSGAARQMRVYYATPEASQAALRRDPSRRTPEAVALPGAPGFADSTY